MRFSSSALFVVDSRVLYFNFVRETAHTSENRRSRKCTIVSNAFDTNHVNIVTAFLTDCKYSQSSIRMAYCRGERGRQCAWSYLLICSAHCSLHIGGVWRSETLSRIPLTRNAIQSKLIWTYGIRDQQQNTQKPKFVIGCARLIGANKIREITHGVLSINTYFFSRFPAPESRKPFANGLLSIFNWVICNRWEKVFSFG